MPGRLHEPPVRIRRTQAGMRGRGPPAARGLGQGRADDSTPRDRSADRPVSRAAGRRGVHVGVAPWATPRPRGVGLVRGPSRTSLSGIGSRATAEVATMKLSRRAGGRMGWSRSRGADHFTPKRQVLKPRRDVNTGAPFMPCSATSRGSPRRPSRLTRTTRCSGPPVHGSSWAGASQAPRTNPGDRLGAMPPPGRPGRRIASAALNSLAVRIAPRSLILQARDESVEVSTPPR